MSSFVDEFWKAVDRWKTDHVEIVVEFVRTAPPRLPERFIGTVMGADMPSVIFRDIQSGYEHTFDFADAEIFMGGFDLVEPFGIVRVFNVAWANADFLTCALMEPREAATLN